MALTPEMLAVVGAVKGDAVTLGVAFLVVVVSIGGLKLMRSAVDGRPSSGGYGGDPLGDWDLGENIVSGQDGYDGDPDFEPGGHYDSLKEWHDVHYGGDAQADREWIADPDVRPDFPEYSPPARTRNQNMGGQ
jgi:hypothetical protein